LRTLHLYYSPRIADLRPLANLKRLQKLRLNDCWRIAPEVRAASESEDWPRFRQLLQQSPRPE
jgi:hypothetical protein